MSGKDSPSDSPRAARDQVLGRIRRSLGRDGPLDGEARAAAEARLDTPPRGIVPEHVRREDTAGRVRLFVEKALAAQATVAEVGDPESVPDAVAEFLAGENLPATLRVADHPDLRAVPWDRRPTLTVTTGPSAGDDPVGVSAALGGVAETGTLALPSGPESPTTLNFLPETHIVLLRKSRIVGPYEDIWRMLRERPDKIGFMPRALNFITGPSRTGDIEQTIELGAHGPLRLHVLLIDDL